MIRAVIVDDEENAIVNLQKMLEKYCEGIEIAGTCSQPKNSIELIRDIKPQLVFLDVEMPFLSGFEVLKNIPDKNFITVFITAHGHYAIKAIKYSAFDYLLKPVDIDELIKTVQRVREHLSTYNTAGYAALIENISNEKPTKLCISTQESNEYIDLNQIVYLHGEGSYTHIYTLDGKKYLVSKNLSEYEKLLQSENFYRPHQSYLIHLDQVKRLVKKDGGYIEMTNGVMVTLARRHKEEFAGIMAKRSKR